MRTRIAPTPSGYLHIGNLFNFFVVDLLAREEGGTVLLRIDDADRERVRDAYVEDIFETLAWAGISWQEGPRDAADFRASWSQQTRRNQAVGYLERLRAEGHLYACACSRVQLAQCHCKEEGLSFEAAEVAWRLRVSGPVLVELNECGMGMREIDLQASVRHAVIRQKDGSPSYQVMSLADDVRFGIDTIVRGRDLLPSTTCQLHLARLLRLDNFLSTRFFHHPLTMAAGGTKLSKSEGATSVRWMRAHGLDASAVRKEAEAYLNGLDRAAQ